MVITINKNTKHFPNAIPLSDLLITLIGIPILFSIFLQVLEALLQQLNKINFLNFFWRKENKISKMRSIKLLLKKRAGPILYSHKG